MEKNQFYQLQWDLLFQPLPIFLLTGILVFTLLAWIFWKKRQMQDFIPGPKELGASEINLKKFYGWVPVILGVHVAIALLINGAQGRLLFSDYQIKEVWSNWIGLTQIMIALAFFYGGLTRPAAIVLGLLWLYSLDLIGLLPMLKSIQYFGYACFFYLAGRGPHAIDRVLFPILEPRENYTNYALLCLRIGIGLTFIVWGLTEKFANISAATSLVKNHAFLNFTGISDEIFVLLAGALEVLGGLLITFGIFPRTVGLIALICINASLTIYNWNELIDYFPLYAALAILLVWEPHNSREKLLWVEGLRQDMK